VNEPAPAASAATLEPLAPALDYHLLRPQLTDTEIAEACRLASEAGLRAVVVRPCDVDQAARWLAGGPILASVVGHPDGVSTTAAKLYEGRDLLRRGAREIEWVMNPARLLSRQFQDVETELEQIARSCEESAATLTIVLRNDLFPPDVKIIATKIAKRVGAARLSLSPALDDLQLILPLLKDRVQLKASGGVATLEEALAARSAGCSIIGSESAAAIAEEGRTKMDQPLPTPSPVS
jgi:deoxyribose-phosphate aldolase